MSNTGKMVMSLDTEEMLWNRLRGAISNLLLEQVCDDDVRI